MKTFSTWSLACIAALTLSSIYTTSAVAIPSNNSDTQITIQRAGFFESLQSSSVTTGDKATSSSSSNNLASKSSRKKPLSCGELISRETKLDYGRYSVDMISTNTRGHVSGFFLISPGGTTEIDIELTGLDSTVGHMNVWKGGWIPTPCQDPTGV
ncbi:hypothetical protein BGX23_008692 [Mortierella sp. AD031]|nr:hypothetical protein BGX23_008692 [Mortierella sp. AD031]